MGSSGVCVLCGCQPFQADNSAMIDIDPPSIDEVAQEPQHYDDDPRLFKYTMGQTLSDKLHHVYESTESAPAFLRVSHEWVPKQLCARLNSNESGAVGVGVSKHGMVEGVPLVNDHKQETEQAYNEMFRWIGPSCILGNKFSIKFHSVSMTAVQKHLFGPCPRSHRTDSEENEGEEGGGNGRMRWPVLNQMLIFASLRCSFSCSDTCWKSPFRPVFVIKQPVFLCKSTI